MTAAAPVKTTWLTDYLTVWAEGAGTVVAALPAARSAKTFKALETAFGRDDVLARWRTAWTATPEAQRRFLTPESFARRYGEFAPPTFDIFGFVSYSPEQADLASRLYGAVTGNALDVAVLRTMLDLPRTFPLTALLLAAYERLRGAHERSLSEHGALVTQQRKSYPAYAERTERLMRALSS